VLSNFTDINYGELYSIYMGIFNIKKWLNDNVYTKHCINVISDNLYSINVINKIFNCHDNNFKYYVNCIIDICNEIYDEFNIKIKFRHVLAHEYDEVEEIYDGNQIVNDLNKNFNYNEMYNIFGYYHWNNIKKYCVNIIINKKVDNDMNYFKQLYQNDNNKYYYNIDDINEFYLWLINEFTIYQLNIIYNIIMNVNQYNDNEIIKECINFIWNSYNFKIIFNCCEEHYKNLVEKCKNMPRFY